MAQDEHQDGHSGATRDEALEPAHEPAHEPAREGAQDDRQERQGSAVAAAGSVARVALVRLTEAPPLLLAVVLGFGLYLLLVLASRIFWVLVMVLIAAVLAAALMPGVELLRRPRFPPGGWRIPKGLAAILIYLVVFGVLGALAYVSIRSFLGEFLQFVTSLPSLAAAFLTRLDTTLTQMGIPPQFIPKESDIVAQLQQISFTLAGGIALTRTALSDLSSFILQVAITLTLSILFVGASNEIMDSWVALFPARHRAKARDVTGRAAAKMSRWVLGQTANATIIAILGGVTSALLGLPYPLLIGLITFLVDLAPVIGPNLLSFPMFFVGLSQSPTVAILIFVAFNVIAYIDANVTSPFIVGRAVNLPPWLTLIMLPLGLAIYGPIGAVLAIPITAALLVVIDEVVLPWLHRSQRASAVRSEAS